MIEAPLFSSAGAKQKATFSLPEPYFDGTVNEPVLHQAVKTFLGNQRQGTAKTKTRSFVSGGNQKPWKQKGTGRARQGSTRAPHWRGGGIVFGPIPRSYRADIPRKVRQLARRSALNARAREGSLFVIEPVIFEAPKTARLAQLFEALGLGEKKVLVLTTALNHNVYLSARNLPGAHVMPFYEASAYDILWAQAIVVERNALTGEPVDAAMSLEAAPVVPIKRAGKSRATSRKGAANPVRAKKPSPKKAAAKAAPSAKAKSAKPASKKKKKESK